MTPECKIFQAVVNAMGSARRRRREVRLIGLCDFDHTVIDADSEELTLHAMVRRGQPGAYERFQAYYDLLDRGEVEPAYRVGAQLFAGMTVAEAEQLVASVMTEEAAFPAGTTEVLCNRTVPRGIAVRPRMKRLIGWLVAAGIEPWLVSASPEVLVRSTASFFGLPIAGVVGNRSIVRGGIITEELEEPVCMFEGKAVRVLGQFEDAELLLAVGDSANDLPLLELSQVNVRGVIPRGNALEAKARQEGWHLLPA